MMNEYYMYDSNDNESTNITYDIYETKDNLYQITVTPSDEFLKEAVYPITIDPEITFGNSGFTGGITDVYSVDLLTNETTYLNDGTVTINNRDKNNSNDDLVIYSYNADYKGGVANIPDSVKYIMNYALQAHTSIKSIVCGESLEKIGSWSCRYLENLEYFEANSKLKSIGYKAFSENPKLKTVILNAGLEYIDDKAFDECPSLEYVVIPASVIDIGYRAFSSGNIYIEVESKPEKWDKSFYGGTAKVFWAGEWEYNEGGILVPIE